MTEASFLTDFPRQLKYMRVRAGLRQEDVAERVGVTRAFISLIESGARLPSMGVMAKIMEALSPSAGSRVAGQEAMDKSFDLKKGMRVRKKSRPVSGGEGSVK